MKLIEAMKELKLIIKKMESNNEQVVKLSSLLSNEKPLVGSSIEDQKKEVNALIQSNEDLFDNYLKLKLLIEKTNTTTSVTINDKTLTITEWLTFRRNASDASRIYLLVNTSAAQGRLSRINNWDKTIEVLPCFDEKIINTKKMEMIDILGKIDWTLEVVNATTDLVE